VSYNGSKLGLVWSPEGGSLKKLLVVLVCSLSILRLKEETPTWKDGGDGSRWKSHGI
jgi:hypothetical protein